ncbi:MAG TPA: type II CAAX endopeptidase family protein [Planctomycetota bacterium]|nr:type II CAAX endopeptidase family protein [Planctomycetota bacterium]
MIRRRPHFADAILVFSIAAAVMMGAGVARGAVRGEEWAWARNLLLVGMQLAWVAIPFAHARLAKVDVVEALSWRMPPPAAWPRLGILWLAVIWLVLGIHKAQTWIYGRLGLEFSEQAAGVEAMLREIAGWGPGFLLLVVTVFPAVAEELVFRGMMLSGFARSFGSARSLIYTSLMFAAVHQMVPRMVVTCFLALVFGLVVLWTRSILAAMLLHLLNNLAALLIVRSMEEHLTPIIFAAAVLTFGFALISLWRVCHVR